MTEFLSVEQLTADRVTSTVEEYTIEGVGTVQIRSLSRAEIMEAGRRFPDDSQQWERFTLSRAMVQPRMSESDVAKWQAACPPGEINGLAMAVNRLSGIEKGADKSDVD